MPSAKESSFDDPPELAYARQLQAGFPRLSFAPVLEQEFRRVNLDQTIGHVRANVVFAILLALAFSAMEALVLGRDVNKIPCLVHILIIVPTLIIVLGVSFSPRLRWSLQFRRLASFLEGGGKRSLARKATR